MINAPGHEAENDEMRFWEHTASFRQDEMCFSQYCASPANDLCSTAYETVLFQDKM